MDRTPSVHGRISLDFSGASPCVIKRISASTPAQRLSALHELHLMQSFSHPHLISLHHFSDHTQFLDLHMEFASKGDLEMLITRTKTAQRRITEPEIWKFAYEILSGLAYLHRLNRVHGDLKAANVFLTSTNQVKLGDFGSCGEVNEVKNLGTPVNHAPELVLNQNLTCKVDIWALGCLLYRLTTLEYPFQGDNLAKLHREIIKKTPKSIPKWYSSRLNAFIMELLRKNSENRPDAEQAMELIPRFYRVTNDVQPLQGLSAVE